MSELFISCEAYGGAAGLGDILSDICQKIDEKNFSLKPYSAEITNVGIIVNCFTDELLIAGFGKPRKYINYKNGYADIRLPMPYIEFKNADSEKAYLMVVDNIVESIEIIGERCKKSKKASFDSDKMISDILEKLEIEKSDLEGINGVIKDRA